MNLEQLVEKMTAHGWRITDQRKTLANIFLQSSGFLSPREVYEEMGKYYSGLSFDTVYRNLRLMAEIGLIEQVTLDGGIKFTLHCDEHHHHHHVICTECETTFSFIFCPMDFTSDIPQDFTVMSHKFEIYGLCKNCKDGSGKS